MKCPICHEWMLFIAYHATFIVTKDFVNLVWYVIGLSVDSHNQMIIWTIALQILWEGVAIKRVRYVLYEDISSFWGQAI